MKKTCRAAVLNGVRDMEIKEFPIPEIKDNDALLEVEMVGVCGSDPHMYQGKNSNVFPIIMSSNNAAPHIPVLYNAAGFSSGNVTGFVSIFGLTLAAGKCIYGGVVDRIGMYRANWILYGLSAVGFLLCCFADSGSIMTAYASVVLLGLGLSIMSVSIPLYAAGAATEKTYPHIMSVFQMMSIIGSLAFGTVPGIMADAMNGSYVPAFIVMLVMAVTGAALLQYGYKAVEHSAGEKGINNRKKNIMITHNAA